MSEIDDAFYRLTVMQRDVAWSEIRSLRAELHQARDLLQTLEELRVASEMLYFAAVNVDLMAAFRKQFPHRHSVLRAALNNIRPTLDRLDPNPPVEEDLPC